MVDAHASGACCLRQWKFESSPGHHTKKSSQRSLFLYGEKNLLICEAATARKTNVTSTLTETKLLSLFISETYEVRPNKKAPNGAFFCMVKRTC